MIVNPEVGPKRLRVREPPLDLRLFEMLMTESKTASISETGNPLLTFPALIHMFGTIRRNKGWSAVALLIRGGFFSPTSPTNLKRVQRERCAPHGHNWVQVPHSNKADRLRGLVEHRCEEMRLRIGGSKGVL